MDGKELRDYVKDNKNLIWPIGTSDFGLNLYTLHFTTMCESLGFTVANTTSCLSDVIPVKFENIQEVEKYFSENKIDRNFWQGDISAIRNDKANSKNIISGGSFGLFTVAMSMLGTKEGLIITRKRPEFVKKIIDVLTEYIIELAIKEYEAGADLFWIAEPTVSLISPKAFESLCLNSYKRIVESVPMAVMLHVCGKTDKHTLLFEATGADVLSIDYCTDIRKVLKAVSSDTIVMGNFSPMVLRDSSKEELRNHTKKYLEEISGFDNIIKSTGCVIAENTPWDNVLLWANMCKEN